MRSVCSRLFAITLFFATLSGVALAGGDEPAADAGDNGNGNVLIDIRARTELVEQEGKQDAELTSVRSLLSWHSPQWGGFRFLGEIENTTFIHDGGFYNGLNGQSQFAKIGNAEFTELQRLQLTYEVSGELSITAGRQYLGFDDGRIIGSPGASQDKNSHDAIRVQYADAGFEVDYVYHDQVNRGPGDRNEWGGESHLFHARYAVNDQVDISGFAYFIDLEGGAATRSNMTYGGWIRGGRDFGQTRLRYAAMFAQQSDYADNPAEFDLDYIVTDVSLYYGPFKLAAGWDRLDGDGVNRILNPLGANHSVLGYADVFSGGGRQGTVDGLEDANLAVYYTIEPDSTVFEEIEFGLRRHQFSSPRTGGDLGSEWDAWVSLDLPNHMALRFDYSDFEGSDDPVSPGDKTKLWVVLSFRR